MENRVASKLAFLFKWDGGDFWRSELISHSFSSLFIQPGIFFPLHILLLSSQLREGGREATLLRALPAGGH